MRRMAVSVAVNGKRQHPGEKEAAFERRRRKQLLLLLWVPLFCWWLQNIDGTTGFALVDKMNRFSTADKLNRSRPATVTNGPRTRTRSGSTDGGQQSYKDQLLSVILQQNSANTSSFAYPAPPSSLVSEQSEHPQFEQVIEEPPNGNMKSKDFGNGEGELDMLFGFFLMNGACIVFFLLFGVCVICNCAARKPKFAGNEQKEKKRKKPTVSRLVAAMAPPGFGQRAKANKAAAAAEQQQNSISGNIPMLHTNGGGGSRRGSTASIRLDQNGNGGGGCLPMAGTPLLSNHSPAQRSFKSLVTRAVAMAKMDTGGKQLAMDLEDATAREGVVESRPPTTAEQRRQSKEMAPFQGSGGNTPARRMSTFSTTIEEPTRRISKLSHCSANECCSLHVLEVPVEVEVHHCPASPTRGSPLLPDLEAALGSAHQKLAYTRSMPLDLAKAAGRLAEPQQICLTEHGQFIVRRETQSSWTGASRPYQSRHRCSLVVPIQMPCGECRVQISSEEEEEDQRQNRKAQKQKEPEEGDGNEEKADGQSSTGSGSRKPSASGGEFSVVRQNLLGPLSFDDLYYIS